MATVSPGDRKDLIGLIVSIALLAYLLVALVLFPEIALWLPHHMSAPP